MDANWPFMELAQAGVQVLDCEHKTPPDAGTGHPYIAIPNIVGGRLNLEHVRRITDADLEAWTRRVTPKAGDVIVTRRGRVGDTAMVPPGLRCAIGQNLVILRSNGVKIDQSYLRWSTRGPSWYAEVDRLINVGAVFESLNVRDISKLRVFVPPRPAQQAIAEILGALDDKIALNERIRETTLGLASACYDAVGTTGESELIGDVAELFDGPHATPQKTETGPWFLSISSLKDGYLDLTESAHLSEDDFPRWTRRVQPRAGDVLFSYETRLGYAALMPSGIRSSLGRRMALLRSKSATVSGSLLLHAYLSPAFQEEIKRRAVHGATVDRLPLKEMPGWRIPLPAQGERERLSAKLDALHASVTQGTDENHTLADLRDTLLPQLLSGKLRVKDAVRTVEEVV
ncbi:restriction endonuclease subunit S [Streptomyces sp. NPDC004673]